MNHLPFDWSDAVDDNHIVAHFIGGGWDGKTYAILNVEEWKIASYPAGDINEFPGVSSKLKYDLVVYKRVWRIENEAIYWYTRTEKGNE